MKIFCIGYNKTGTTSLTKLMNENNIKTAPQTPFEFNLESYFYENYNTFTNMIKDDYYYYSFFQDVPFSLPKFYKFLDKEFENAKFILTVRDTEDEWYDSLIRFYKKMFLNFHNPKNIGGYVYEGIIFKILTKVYGAPKEDPYNSKILKKSYLNHISDVKEYFKDKDNLLVVNLKDEDLIEKIENFLDTEFNNKNVPHLNRTK